MDDELALNPAHRRRWLLTKALEVAPLKDALALAQAAEDFLCGGPDEQRILEVTQAPAFGETSETKGAGQKSSSALAIENASPIMNAETLAGLRSLVSIDDVVRYLRQGGTVVADDKSADELLALANLKRMEQRLPTFEMLPEVLTKEKGLSARSRPPTQRVPNEAAAPETLDRTEEGGKGSTRSPNARARADWARSVIGLTPSP